MTKEEYMKKVKWTKIFCIIIGVLFILGFFIGISEQNYINAVLSLGFIILLYSFYYFVKKGKIAGPIIGIILGALYILELDIFTIIVGAFIIIDSISMIKFIKDGSNQIDECYRDDETSERKRMKKKNKLFVIILIIAFVCVIALAIVGNVVLRSSNNLEKENQDTNLKEYYISENTTMTYDKNEWYEDKEMGKEIESFIGEKRIVLTHKNKDMSLVFVVEEDFSKEYEFSTRKGREIFYEDLFENFDYEDENKKKSEEFKSLNNNLYYAYGETYNTVFGTYDRQYVVINSETGNSYVFTVSTRENKFTKEQEESILKILKTIKSK